MKTAIIEGFSNYVIYYTLNPQKSIWSNFKNKWLEGSDNNGYYMYGLIDDNGKENTKCLHKWYAMAFIPNPLGLSDVHHINHDKTNNRLENLMWINHEDHVKLHAQSDITNKKRSDSLKGEKSYRYGKPKPEGAGIPPKPVVQYTKDENLLCVYESTHEAERQTGCYQGNISNCCNGKRKTTGGFKWRYATQEEYENYLASVA